MVTAIRPTSNGAEAEIGYTEPYVATITIRGVAPILFHAWNNEAVEQKAKAAKNSKSKKTDNLESYVYRTANQTLGIPGDAGHPDVVKYVERALATCRRVNMPCGVHTFDVPSAKQWIQKGMRFMACGNEVTWLVDAGQKASAEIKEAIPHQ